MRTDLRLSIRLLRGGGRAGLARLVLLALGTAVAVVAVLIVAQLPRVVADRDATLAERQAQPSTETAPGPGLFAYTATQLSWQGSPLTRVFIVAGDSDAAPPGLRQLPGAGEVALSPRAEKLRSDPRLRALTPGRVVATVSPEGLTEPNELVAYVGVKRSELRSPRFSRGWGVPTTTDVEGAQQFRSIAVELGLLVVPAVLVFLAVCARIAAATRRRRLAALRLLGVGRRTLERVALIEAAASTVLGLLLGMALFLLTNDAIARTGAVGLRWFPERVGLQPPPIVGLVLIAGLGVRAGSRVAARRASTSTLEQRRRPSDRPPRWWSVLPLALGLSLLLPWLPIGSAKDPGEAGGAIILAGAALAAIGMLTTARLALHHSAAVLTRARWPLGVRLGAHRLRDDASSAVRVAAGLGLLVLITTVATGVTTGAERNAASELRPISIRVYGNEVSPAAAEQLVDLNPGGSSWLTVSSVVTPTTAPDDGSVRWSIDHLGVRMLVAPCAELRRLTANPDWACVDGASYRVAADDTSEDVLPAGTPIRFRRGEAVTTVTAPDPKVRVAVDAEASTSQLLHAGERPPLGWSDDTVAHFVVPAGLRSLDLFTSRLATIAPTATANSSVDLTGITTYRVHRATLQFGTAVAFGLGVIAAVIALVDRALERRRLTVELVVLGASARTIRAAQLTFALVPFVVLAAMATVVGTLIATTVSGADTGGSDWTWRPLLTSLPLTCLGIATSVAAGSVIIGRRPRPEDFRDA